MQHDELEAALLATIDDRRVTRSERKALRALVEDGDLDAHARNLLRSRAFDIARETLDNPRSKEVLDWLQDVHVRGRAFGAAPRRLRPPLQACGCDVPPFSASLPASAAA